MIVVIQAKRDLYFEFLDPDIEPRLFMKKGDCRVMMGLCSKMVGSREIMHTEDNFNFFVPMTKANVKAALDEAHK